MRRVHWLTTELSMAYGLPLSVRRTVVTISLTILSLGWMMMTNVPTYNGMHMCKQCKRIERTIVCVYDDQVEVTCDRCGSLSVHPIRPEGVTLGDPIPRARMYATR